MRNHSILTSWTKSLILIYIVVSFFFALLIMSRRILNCQLRVGRWWYDCRCWPLGCLTYSGDSGEPGHSRFGNLGNGEDMIIVKRIFQYDNNNNMCLIIIFIRVNDL